MPSSDAAVVWLAVGAISLALMALLQIAAVVALIKVATDAQRTVHGLQAQIAPLVHHGQALITRAGDVVDQAHDVVSHVAAQVNRVEGAVDAASKGVNDVRHGVRQVTARATGLLSGAQAFWWVIRGRRRNAA